jgi:hypothetical protein
LPLWSRQFQASVFGCEETILERKAVRDDSTASHELGEVREHLLR